MISSECVHFFDRRRSLRSKKILTLLVSCLSLHMSISLFIFIKSNIFSPSKAVSQICLCGLSLSSVAGAEFDSLLNWETQRKISVFKKVFREVWVWGGVLKFTNTVKCTEISITSLWVNRTFSDCIQPQLSIKQQQKQLILF